MYGSDSLHYNDTDIKRLDSLQGTFIKRAMGIRKRSHHSDILNALSIPKIHELRINNILSLYNRIFKVDSPTRELNCVFLAEYLITGRSVKGTILDSILKSGFSPVRTAFVKCPRKFYDFNHRDGIVDSIRSLLINENFIKPWSTEHSIVQLLTQAF